MKCIICDTDFNPETEDQDVCENCLPAVTNLIDGKGSDEDE